MPIDIAQAGARVVTRTGLWTRLDERREQVSDPVGRFWGWYDRLVHRRIVAEQVMTYRKRLGTLLRGGFPGPTGRVVGVLGDQTQSATTALLSSVLAEQLSRLLVAVDFTPPRADSSSLVRLVKTNPDPDTRRLVDLAKECRAISTPTALARYLDNESRVHLVHNDGIGPEVFAGLGQHQFSDVLKLLRDQSQLVLVCADGDLAAPSSRAALVGTDHLVLTYSIESLTDGQPPYISGYLEHGFAELVTTSIAVLTVTDPATSEQVIASRISWFEEHCAAVIVLPFEPGLGGRLGQPTAVAHQHRSSDSPAAMNPRRAANRQLHQSQLAPDTQLEVLRAAFQLSLQIIVNSAASQPAGYSSPGKWPSTRWPNTNDHHFDPDANRQF